MILIGMAFAVYVSMLIAVRSMGAAARSGSYQRSAQSPLRVYTPPGRIAVGGLTLLIEITLLVVLTLNRETLQPAWDGAVSYALFRSLLVVLPLAALSYWGVVRWMRQKCSLVLDKERKTYRSIDLSGVAWKVRTGAWEDIAGVCVRRAKTSRGNDTFAYYVALRWRGASRLYSVLGGFGERDQAGMYAERVARDLGLPLVPVE